MDELTFHVVNQSQDFRQKFFLCFDSSLGFVFLLELPFVDTPFSDILPGDLVVFPVIFDITVSSVPTRLFSSGAKLPLLALCNLPFSSASNAIPSAGCDVILSVGCI